MESMLGFNDIAEEKSHSFKLVPWINWDEWKFVRESLFSSSPHSVASALQRISTWRSRGNNPVSIEVTASIVEIQQKDPYFRNDLNDSSSQSEEMLAMLYCMAIMRLVNGVVEKTRKKNEISIGEAADAIGIPRMLIDIRHEGSHRDLPSLQLVRLASKKALDWLVTYYWEPQEKVIPTQSNLTANLRKEIKSRLREVALYLKAKEIEKSSPSHVKGKHDDQSHKNSTKSRQVDLLSQLLAWLIENLRTLNPVVKKESVESKSPKTERHLTESTVLVLLRRCRLLSSPNNKQLMQSALNLARLTLNAPLLQKLKKLALLNQLPKTESNSANSPDEESSIRQAEERFELIKQRVKGKYGEVDRSEVVVGVKRKWTVAKSWDSCPIGMLPSKFGFSGRLPHLETVLLSDDKEENKTILGKREAEIGVDEMDITPAKKLVTGPGYSEMLDIQGDVSGVKGRLMIDGTWKKVGEGELFTIASAVKLLV